MTSSSGVRTIDSGGRDYLAKIMHFDSRLVVVGGDTTNGGRTSVRQLNLTGTTDPTFGNSTGVAYWDPNAAGNDLPVDAVMRDDYILVSSNDSRNGGDASLEAFDANGILQSNTNPGIARYSVLGYSLDNFHITGDLTVGTESSSTTVQLDAARVYGPIEVDGDVSVSSNSVLANPSQAKLTVGGDLTLDGTYFSLGNTLELRPRSKSARVNVTSSTTFGGLSIIGTQGPTTVSFDASDPITVTGTFSAYGVSCSSPLRLRPLGSTWTLNNTGGSVATNFLDLAGTTMSPGRTVQNSYNAGSNTGVTFGGSSCAAPPLTAPDTFLTNATRHARNVTASPAPTFTYTNRSGSTIDRADIQVSSSHTDSIQAAYRMDDLTEANGGAPLTASGGYTPTYVTGKFGQALSIGSTAGHTLYGSAVLATPQEWTIDGWFKRPPLTGADDPYPMLVYKGNGAGNVAYQIVFLRDSNELCANFTVSGAYKMICTPASPYTNNAWHHAAFVWREHKMSLIVDGIEMVSQREWGTPDTGSWLTAWGAQLNGAIDDWQIRSVGDDMATIRGYYNTQRRHFDVVWATSLAATGSVANDAEATVTYGGTTDALARDGARYWVQSRMRTAVGSIYTSWSRPDWFSTQLNSLTVSLPGGPNQNFGALTTTNDYTNPFSVSVTTTAESGWSMYAYGEDDTYAMSNGLSGATNQIARRTTALWPAGTAGFAGITVLTAPGGKDTGTWGSGTTGSDYANLRYAWPALTSPTLIHTYPTYNTSTNTVSLSTRVNTTATTRAGNYRGRLEFTVVPNV